MHLERVRDVAMGSIAWECLVAFEDFLGRVIHHSTLRSGYPQSAIR